MNILPIIVRELRAEARHSVNYALRTFGAMILTVCLGVLLWGQDSTQSGGNAFRALSLIIFFAIWIVVPLLIADCLSREKREGTLGLLFLTPLKPIEIVLGKGAIHAIRSLTLLIAGIPILAIPFLLGGITGANVFWSLLLNLTALLIALASGLLASSLCRQWTRALILAEIFSVFFLWAFVKLTFVLLFSSYAPSRTFLWELGALIELLFSPGGFRLIGSLGISAEQISSAVISILSFAGATFGAVVCFASNRLKNTWQENPASRRQQWIQKTFCTPRFFVGFLRRKNQSRLSRNPIGWLQQYSWSARLSKWGWCAVMITILSWLVVADFRLLIMGCVWLKNALLVSMAFSAVSSFQREKQNGALELLLVTPLREKQIILGRLRGIWGQFLPAFAILLLAVLAVPDIYGYGNYFGRERDGLNILSATRDFIVVPIVGLYFAMRSKNLLAAWLSTCGLTLFLPKLASGFLAAVIFPSWDFDSAESFLFALSCVQNGWFLILTMVTASLLFSQLKNRTFALARS